MKFPWNRERQGPLMVGICGRSCSGKGAVCEAIAGRNSEVLHIDSDIFFTGTTSCVYKGYQCWEHTDCVRWNHLVETFAALRAGTGAIIQDRSAWTGSYDVEVMPDDLRKRNIVLVEGFLLFTMKSVLELLDSRIFIDVSDYNLLLRRLKRQGSMNGMNYVDEVIVPVSKEYEPKLRNTADMVFDGNLAKQDVAKSVTGYINELLSRKSFSTQLSSSPQAPTWQVHFGDLVTDHAWHSVDFHELKDWVKQRRNELDTGHELAGNTFTYRRNPGHGSYELRLSGRRHMYRYSREPT